MQFILIETITILISKETPITKVTTMTQIIKNNLLNLHNRLNLLKINGGKIKILIQNLIYYLPMIITEGIIKAIIRIRIGVKKNSKTITINNTIPKKLISLTVTPTVNLKIGISFKKNNNNSPVIINKLIK